MLKFMNKVPAGTFLIPLFVSAIVYTLWPTLLQDGGMLEGFLGGQNIGFMIAFLTFAAGLNIDLKGLVAILKYQGILILIKLVIAFIVSILYIKFFGEGGILGISAIALVTVLVSTNPALYVSLAGEYGDQEDVTAFALTAAIVIPATPMLVYAMAGGGTIDWASIISTIIPLIIGIVLGNLDPNFKVLFKDAVAMMLPILGWNLGQGINLIEGLQAGLSGVLLLLVYYLFMSIHVLVDRFVFKKSGAIGMSLNSVAGSSSSFPAIIAVSYPAVAPYVASATAQLVTCAILSLILTPVLVRLLDGGGKKEG